MRQKHRSRRYALLWATVAAGLALRPAGAQNIPVTAGGNASSLVGVDFDLPIYIDMSARTEKLGSFALVVRWNPAVLKLVGGQNGNFGGVALNEDSVATGALIASGANPAGVGGQVTAVIPRLRPLTTATDTIRIEVRELYAATSFADLSGSALASSRTYCQARGRFGDIDGDGNANSRDALIALTAAVGSSVSPFDATLGDVDGDGGTKARDALIILSNAVGLDVKAFRVFFIAPGACATAPTRPGLTLTPGNLTLLVGQSVAYVATATDSSGNSLTVSDVSWTTNNQRVATVTPDGLVVGLDTGTAKVTARRSGTVDSVTATLTVIADRSAHWVDALSYNETNQLGTPEYPFATIQQGVAFAGPGDTVHVRAGRYEPSISIQKNLVVMGEVLGGAASLAAGASPAGTVPMVAAAGSYRTGFFISRAARVEIHNLDLDTLYRAISAFAVDTLRLRNLRYRQPRYGYAGVQVDSVGLLQAAQLEFFGRGGDYYYYGSGILAGSARVVSVDSSLFVAFESGGIQGYLLDSLFVGRSRFLGSGIWVCSACSSDTSRTSAVVLSRNRFEGGGAAVYVDRYRLAAFDHNVIRTEDDAIELYGRAPTGGGGGGESTSRAATATLPAGLVTFLGDSIRVRWYTWLYLFGYDSLLVDSLTADIHDGWSLMEGGRMAVLRNSLFRLYDWGEALYVDAWPGDSTNLVVRNTTFWSDSTRCSRCGYGVEGDETWIDAETVTAVNLYEGFDVYYGGLAVRNSSFSRTRYDIDSYCGPVSVSNITSVDADYSIGAYGCYYQQAQPLSVTGSTFERNYSAIESDYMPTTITNNTIRNSNYAIEVYDGNLTAADNQITDIRYDGIFFYGYSGRVATVERNVLSCLDAYYTYGIEMDGAEMHIRNNTVTGCDEGIEVYNYLSSYSLPAPVPVEIRGNSITLPSSVGWVGIEADGPAALISIIRNTVTGPAEYGSIYAGGYSGSPFAVVDSNTVSGSIEAGIWARYVDTLRIRDNVIANHGQSTCCVGGPSAAILISYLSSTGDTVQVRRNRISGSAANGIVLYSYAHPRLILVDSNTVKGADSIAVWASYNDRAWVRFNALDSTGMDAVRLSLLLSDTSAKVNQNNFTRSGRGASGGYGLNNTTGFRIDGTNNWWNDAQGPRGFYGDSVAPFSTGDSVSANVNWDPWLVAAAPTPSLAPALVAALPAAGAPAAAPISRLSRERVAEMPAPRDAVEVRPDRPTRDVKVRATFDPTQITDPALQRQVSTVERVLAQRAQFRMAQDQRLDSARAARDERRAERIRGLEAKRQEVEARRADKRSGVKQ